MPTILMSLLRWFGTVGAGWMVSDIFNERQRTQQQNPNQKVDLVEAAKASLKANWIKYAIVAVIALIVLYIVKPKK